tara:strand:+ start:55 stop:828 length:774 start_codon:yes stop_codon:yes gene_type:complete
MARTLELDTLDHPGNTGTANIVLSSDGMTTMPLVNINGGAIDGATIGAQSPSTIVDSVGALAGAPRILKYVHMHGSNYEVTNSDHQRVCHDAVSYSVTVGKSYKIEVLCNFKGAAVSGSGGQHAYYEVGLHVQTTNHSQGDSQSIDFTGSGPISLNQGVIASTISGLRTNASSNTYVERNHDSINLWGIYTPTASATHYTYLTAYGHSTSEWTFLLETQDSAYPTSNNSDWTQHSGVKCKYIISEIGSVPITNQNAA